MPAPALLYANETWTTTKKSENKIPTCRWLDLNTFTINENAKGNKIKKNT